MKSAVIAGFLASVLYSQQAVATYGWNDAQKFSSPDNTDNQCTGEQSGGYSWGDVPTGKVGNFDGMDFSGFDCKDSFNVQSGKRGLIRRTQFQGKAIVGKATQDDASCPKISSQQKGFSINEMQVSTDKDDAELTFEYTMEDGSTCKQKATCGQDGKTVKNTQCGGAKEVKVKGDCNFGFHSIGFDCNPATSQPPVSSPTGGVTSSTQVCKSTETLTGGSCVPTPPATTPVTTTALTCEETETKDANGSCVKTPTGGITSTTPPASTTSCKEGETINAQGSCQPPTTSTSTCAETESMNDKGTCTPRTPTGGIATPVTTPTTTPATTSATTPATTPATTTVAATTSCAAGETPNDKGSCVPSQPPTGGVTSTGTTTADGSQPTPPTCRDTEELSNSSCVPQSQTGGTTTSPPATSDLVTTEIVVTTLTTCPVTVTSGSITSVTQTVSTTTITSTATFCPKCGEAPPTQITTVDSNQPTPPTCKDTEELVSGTCVPKTPTGGLTSTSTPVPTTSAPSCKEGKVSSNGQCVPQSSSTPLPTTTSLVCKEGEKVENGACVPQGPTGGVSSPTTSAVSTPATTTISTTSSVSCKQGEVMNDGKCVPSSTTQQVSTTAAPSCKADEELSNGKCTSKTPTGGQTSSTSSTVVSPQPPNETPIPEAPCPNVLPRCLSTWMQKAGSCSDNSDISCYCPSPDFISTVQECVSAWANNDDEVQGALSFLVGICANFVPQNPGICTGVPSTITLVPTPSAPSTTTAVVTVTGGSAPAPTAPPASDLPSTVITFTRTLTSGSTTTQTVTVPQVVFNTITQSVVASGGVTQTVTQTQGVGLVPAVPQVTTPAASPPAASTPVAGATGASTFVPSSTTNGVAATPSSGPSNTGSSSGPIATFTGSASKAGFGAAAGLFAAIAFLA